MNLSELKIKVDDAIKNLHKDQRPEDITVLITLDEDSIGQRACSGIRNINLGFDWERDQLRLEPEKPLVCKEYSL